ncbi:MULTISPECIES: UDP-N-acetylmuramoyl-L-alanyl-D-glutamate--2,6-diaminopimelate ligase [unclassified Prochlorococcus]|uniref:UDP-N-acetylmuramoyl-L-alanyl-D-glutamate--2, 6-diaminopimelate ligase n=1 Tax=unclassified Prochlorococcus TaxID=2627481 RepID=UPI000533AC2B|nr:MULTISPECIES: UDP-N-acetylmuramoyl-L-alanyl-D-glutamate--2,6-diaminopimelate ligase [unclassified Prochlorococcus]KGG16547.1 UDP-N-acetylmuramoylalanyl-D-glutamate--2,6- diaminopimelate ligase [Prochlorococcus sp. MIT 0602]KGG16978.1 UDP-N-acetylmuramoylalanyl-D-glutamate--2,6- diaminopimelate ligase [Prochlorococcus sp. MIT 0603]
MTYKLHSLLKEIGIDSPIVLEDLLVESIGCDSRSPREGELFFGLQGARVDGGMFWRQALASGAIGAVISQKAAEVDPPGSQDIVFVVPDPVSVWMGEAASLFWQKPSLKINLIGVTGTNGKTTTSYLIEHLSSTSGLKSALFGTLVNRWPGHSEISSHTTAFGDVLQTQLAQAVLAGVGLGVMEVSSHALAQGRVAGCRFAGAVFTNLTQDHLDYHDSMEEYFNVKSLLFKSPLLKDGIARSVVNIDDPWGRRLSETLGDSCWRSSLNHTKKESIQPELFFTDLEKTSRGVEGILHSPAGEGSFFSPLIGDFNLMNLLQAVGALLQQGIPLDALLPAIKSFPGIPGRMEQVRIKGELPIVIVDYAHTPDGLQNALTALRPLVSGKLYCVFGCGGDRDRGKRSQMGAIASELADEILLTSDNPRTENPQQILDDVVMGMSVKKEIIIEIDRGAAIRKAIFMALPEDIILIAGKGHESYQILGLEKVEFDDRDIAREALASKLSV